MDSRVARFGIKATKFFGGALIVLILLYVLLYNFAPIYGGKYYQKESFRGSATITLKKFKEEQDWYFNEHKVYRRDLLSREPYNRVKRFVFGFAEDNSDIARLCPDCRFTDTSYKIAALGKFGDREALWVMDRNGIISNPIPLD